MPTIEQRILAPAKVNLYLRVCGRRPDGYHLLDSLMIPVDLYDHISIRLSDPIHAEPGITISTSGMPAPADETNLAYRAAALFAAKTRWPIDIALDVHKRIPVGSGLGGGSSDAAAVLLCLNRTLDRALGAPELAALGRQLGADVPFFMVGRPARVEGIGDTVTPLPDWKISPLVICFDGRCLSTASVYAGVDLSLTSGRMVSNICDFANGREPISALLVNDLEAAAAQIHPAVLTLKAKLVDQGAVGTLMTGSGSAVFGMWPDAESAQTAALRLRQDGLWAEAVHALECSPAVMDDGRSPSGKAPDFGSGIEGSNPSRPVTR